MRAFAAVCEGSLRLRCPEHDRPQLAAGALDLSRCRCPLREAILRSSERWGSPTGKKTNSKRRPHNVLHSVNVDGVEPGRRVAIEVPYEARSMLRIVRMAQHLPLGDLHQDGIHPLK